MLTSSVTVPLFRSSGVVSIASRRQDGISSVCSFSPSELSLVWHSLTKRDTSKQFADDFICPRIRRVSSLSTPSSIDRLLLLDDTILPSSSLPSRSFLHDPPLQTRIDRYRFIVSSTGQSTDQHRTTNNDTASALATACIRRAIRFCSCSLQQTIANSQPTTQASETRSTMLD